MTIFYLASCGVPLFEEPFKKCYFYIIGATKKKLGAFCVCDCRTDFNKMNQNLRQSKSLSCQITIMISLKTLSSQTNGAWILIRSVIIINSLNSVVRPEHVVQREITFSPTITTHYTLEPKCFVCIHTALILHFYFIFRKFVTLLLGSMQRRLPIETVNWLDHLYSINPYPDRFQVGRIAFHCNIQGSRVRVSNEITYFVLLSLLI